MSITRDNGLSPADRAYADQVNAFLDDWDKHLTESINAAAALVAGFDAAPDDETRRVLIDWARQQERAELDRRRELLVMAARLLREVRA